MYRRRTTLPPQKKADVISKVAYSREENKQSVLLSNTELKLNVSSNPRKIHCSVCICIVMNTDDELDIVSNNLSCLQSLFEKSFIVFVIDSESSLIEWSTRHENSLTIQTTFTEEHAKRNLYLKFVHDNKLSFNYMMVIDPLISLKTPLKPESFDFFRKDTEFNAMFANQTYKYYDIESLVDDKKQVYRIDDMEVKQKKIKQYQVHIPKNSGLIPVNSAFGGFAVYKTSVLDTGNKYTTDNHISFNLNISKAYSKMFIDSSFIIETNPNNSFLYEK
jgi:hypothetical protein